MMRAIQSASLFALRLSSAASAQENCGFPVSLINSGFEAGEQSTSVQLPPDNTPLTLNISGPADGSTVGINAVQFYGTYSGPSNTGVSVNGVSALTNANAFVVPRILLQAGTNTITIRYASTDSAPVVSIRTINYQPATPTVLLAASGPGDYAPTTMPFSLATAFPPGQSSVTRVQVDYNNDGVFEVDSPVPIPLQYSYEEPGLFVAKARVTFDDGNNATPMVIVEDQTRVLIQSMAFTRQTLCRLYDGMKTRLIQNQIALALNTVAVPIKPRFEALWTALGQANTLATVAARLGLIVDGQLSRNSAELRVAITTQTPGVFRGYTVLFRRDESGVWRIGRM